QWDGLRDHSEENVSDSLWQRLSTDKASCLGAHCRWYRECPSRLKQSSTSRVINSVACAYCTCLKAKNSTPVITIRIN
ncbi:hypothetical protein HZD82_27195, partial [Pantoea agglomerans]|uniref:hypothetical protein n=1 Tax=Enterobacter agglomerans TaxID=549 RepID=UPI001A8CEED5